MRTLVGVFALVAMLSPGQSLSAAEPSWSGDYHAAQKRAAAEKKPLAVFIGKGQGAQEKVATEGTFNPAIKKVLGDNYVCVYLDSTQASAKGLISALAITKGQGLVLSDRTGAYQAYHHDGPLSQSELAQQLTHFSNPNLEIRTTVSNGRVSYYPNGGSSSASRSAPVTVRC